MIGSSKIDSSEYTDLNKVIGWFIALRWVACFGVFIALLTADFKFYLILPYKILFLLNGLLFLINLIYIIYFSYLKHRNLSRREMRIFFNVQIFCDYGILFFLLYFTGFLENPFSYYFVFHIMLTSFIYSSTVVFTYVGVLTVVFSGILIAEYYQVIPHFSKNIFINSSYNEISFFKVFGLFSTLIISAYLITSIKKRIQEKGKRVEVELDRYKSLDKIKSNFILQVTHELRGPIAALMGYHEMVMKGITGKINQKTEEVIFKANRRTGNLLNIIDEMIDYAFMKSEVEVNYEKNRVQLKSIIEYNLDLILNQAKEKGINLISNCSKDLMVLANRDLINIIINNLLTNSIRYSSKGTTITVNASADNGEIHFLIKDEGMGIEPSELENIFEEFYRTRRAREIEKDGTGLGLPIVKRAVERMNGKISVYSEVDKGTTFHVYLHQYIPEKKNNGVKNG